jgi:hypothetical protein
MLQQIDDDPKERSVEIKRSKYSGFEVAKRNVSNFLKVEIKSIKEMQ